jgi:hypothetical protein
LKIFHANFFAFIVLSRVENQVPSPNVFESQMILTKPGMIVKIEAAILAHSKKFHPYGPEVWEISLPFFIQVRISFFL